MTSTGGTRTAALPRVVEPPRPVPSTGTLPVDRNGHANHLQVRARYEAAAMAPVTDDERRDLLRERIESFGRFQTGGSFLFDVPECETPIWGEGDRVLWSPGEPFMLGGGTGVGKTTLMQQVVMGLLGLTDRVLGFPVAVEPRRVLYLACDRPKQVQRSFRRMVSEADRELLDARLVIWRGPIPGNLVREPNLIADMARHFGAGTVIGDSTKDLLPKLTDDEAAIAANAAFQACVADGTELGLLHHPRKSTAGESQRPKAVDDLYGSTWLTAGMGSVGYLHGAPGDLVVTFLHLKQPMEMVGPFTVEHDHRIGRSTVTAGPVSALDFLRRCTNGATSTDLAVAQTGKSDPSKNDQKRARLALQRLVDEGIAHHVGGSAGGRGGSSAGRYFLTAQRAEAGGS